jgi:hypothetical protein
VLSCDYNGWADVPEEEREAVEAFELGRETPPDPPPALMIKVSMPPPLLRQRKAA